MRKSIHFMLYSLLLGALLAFNGCQHVAETEEQGNSRDVEALSDRSEYMEEVKESDNETFETDSLARSLQDHPKALTRYSQQEVPALSDRELSSPLDTQKILPVTPDITENQPENILEKKNIPSPIIQKKSAEYQQNIPAPKPSPLPKKEPKKINLVGNSNTAIPVVQASKEIPRKEFAKLTKKHVVSPSIRYGKVSGSVSLSSKGKMLQAKNIILSLEPDEPNKIPRRPPKIHRITMKNKRYLPRYYRIKIGDSIVFSNQDVFKHNVFSLSGKNSFDLGTYGKNTKPDYTFEHPGMVKIYCNIHFRMAAFVMVSSSDYGAITGKNGRFDIDNVPSGEYTLKAWSIRGSTEKKIVVSANNTTTIVLDIDNSSYREKKHLNKYRKKYKKRSSNEFY